MSPMIDRVIKNGVRCVYPIFDNLKFREMKEVLKGATALDISNVADYFFTGNDQEYWYFDKDFPNISPPWNTIWFNWKMPSYIFTEGEKIPVKDHRFIKNLATFLFVKSNIDFIPQYKDAKWIITAFFFLETIEGIYIYPNAITYGVYPNGIYCPLDKNNPVSYITNLLYLDISEEHYKNLNSVASGYLDVVFMALSFIHCKNVKVIEKKNQFLKKHNKVNKKNFIKYYELEIDGIKRILEDKKFSEKVGIKKALHICRGHFATYTSEAPLFGKVTGTFWKSMHIRGSSEIGTIVKDYKIKL